MDILIKGDFLANRINQKKKTCLQNKIYSEIIQIIDEIYNPVFCETKWKPSLPLLIQQIGSKDSTTKVHHIGNVEIPVQPEYYAANQADLKNFQTLMATQMDLLEKLAACATTNWLTLLIGPAHVGKRSAMRTLAMMFGQRLHMMRVNDGTDALDLLGSFEQVSGKWSKEKHGGGG